MREELDGDLDSGSVLREPDGSEAAFTNGPNQPVPRRDRRIFSRVLLDVVGELLHDGALFAALEIRHEGSGCVRGRRLGRGSSGARQFATRVIHPQRLPSTDAHTLTSAAGVAKRDAHCVQNASENCWAWPS